MRLNLTMWRVYMIHCRFFLLCVFLLTFFAACSDENEVKVSSGNTLTQEQIDYAQNLDKASYEGLEDVFLDTKDIQSSESKITLVIFGKNNCIYCDKLKDDIKRTPLLKSYLQEHFMPYYVNTSYAKTHTLHFGKDGVGTESLGTNALMNRFVNSPMRPTPTLVFLTQEGKSIYELPGYLPPLQILALLEYIDSRAWQGKSNDVIAQEINKVIQS